MPCHEVFQVLLDRLWQPMLHERTDFTTVGPMAITDRKEVAVSEAHDVWVRYVGILVHFERVAR